MTFINLIDFLPDYIPQDRFQECWGQRSETPLTFAEN